MRPYFTQMFIVLFLAGGVFSQFENKHAESRLKDERKNGSSIFVKAACEGNSDVRFRLFNNSNWAIAVPTFSFYLTPDNVRRAVLQDGSKVYLLPNNKEIASLFYYTERETPPRANKRSLHVGGYHTDSYNTSWVGSQDSILFSIPKHELKDEPEVYISFSYEWERNDKGTLFPKEVQHRVYFRYPDHNSPQKFAACSKI